MNVVNGKNCNHNIHCTVQQCVHNAGTECYCCLDQVEIGTHEMDPKVPQCIDCNSFVKKCDC